MLEELKIKLANTVSCPPDWSWESNKNGWNGYHLWYVLEGGATVKVDGEEYLLNKGDCFLFDLNKNHFCTHNPQNPLHVATIYLQNNPLLPLSVSRWVIYNNTTLGKMILRCIQLHSTNTGYAENYLKSILVEFLVNDEKKYERKLSLPVQKLLKCFEKNFSKMYSLDEMCDLTDYSKNQIIRLFRNDTGMTPLQFQMHQKMQYAAQMLLYSDKTITEISLETGMEDTNYFSKTFKKYIGKSPRHYRDSYRNA